MSGVGVFLIYSRKIMERKKKPPCVTLGFWVSNNNLCNLSCANETCRGKLNAFTALLNTLCESWLVRTSLHWLFSLPCGCWVIWSHPSLSLKVGCIICFQLFTRALWSFIWLWCLQFFLQFHTIWPNRLLTTAHLYSAAHYFWHPWLRCVLGF